MLFAIVATAAFSLTIFNPERAQLVDGSKNVAMRRNDAAVYTSKILDDVNQMEPCRLLSSGKPDEAVGAAKGLYNENKYDVRTAMCAGNVLTQAEGGDKSRGYELLKLSTYLAPESRYVHLNRAQKLEAGGKLQEAAEVYETLSKDWPDQDYPLALLYMRTGKAGLAVEKLRKISEGDPNNGAVQKELGVALAIDGKTKEGYEQFLKGVETEQKVVGHPWDAHDLVTKYGTIDATITKLKQDAAANPKNAETKAILSELLLYANRPKEAKEVATDAKKVDAESVKVHQVLTEILSRLNDSDEAFSEFKVAIKLTKK